MAAADVDLRRAAGEVRGAVRLLIHHDEEKPIVCGATKDTKATKHTKITNKGKPRKHEKREDSAGRRPERLSRSGLSCVIDSGLPLGYSRTNDRVIHFRGGGPSGKTRKSHFLVIHPAEQSG
jgi:hypothetical protein